MTVNDFQDRRWTSKQETNDLEATMSGKRTTLKNPNIPNVVCKPPFFRDITSASNTPLCTPIIRLHNLIRFLLGLPNSQWGQSLFEGAFIFTMSKVFKKYVCK